MIPFLEWYWLCDFGKLDLKDASPLLCTEENNIPAKLMLEFFEVLCPLIRK